MPKARVQNRVVVAQGFKEEYQAAKASNSDIQGNLTIFNKYKREVPPKALPAEMKDHKLSGRLKAYRECHLAPDVLLLYKSKGGTFKLLGICNHADLHGPKEKALAKKLKGRG